MGYRDSFRKIAESIRKNKYDWVLVLGTGVSCSAEGKAYKAAEVVKEVEKFINQKLQLKHETVEQDRVMDKIYSSIQMGRYQEVMDILYGNIWDNSSFLYTEGAKQKKRREHYAEGLADREHINLACYHTMDLRALLEKFSGIILTTCQDETIEAFLEDELCMTIKNHVYTPYSLTTSLHWKKRLEQQLPVLIKLYGTRAEPCHLLLSSEDMNMYYPAAEAGEIQDEDIPNTMKMLDWLFQNKNLLFIGMDLFNNNKNLQKEPATADGIIELLKKEMPESTGTDGLLRYIIEESNTEQNIISESYYSDLHMNAIISPKGNIREIVRELIEQIETGTDVSFPPKTCENAETDRKQAGFLTKKDAIELFWENYNRRPKHRISDREKHILGSHILEAGEASDIIKYSSKDIEGLAMAANNFAEFGDLWKAMKMAKKTLERELERSGETCRKEVSNGEIVKRILTERIGGRGKELSQILNHYRGGFPMVFLNLIDGGEEKLNQWKKAGIQLTNSGIYIQSHSRKMIYEKLEYTDSLVQTAGVNPHKEQFRRRLLEKANQIEDSYFYPVKTDILEDKDSKAGEDSKKRVKKKYAEMLRRLGNILKNRSEGYSHLRSLLETELPTILRIVDELDDNDKPKLLYYLFRECPIQPDRLPNWKDNAQTFLERIEELRRKIAGSECDKETLCKLLMLYQVQIIVLSQQSEEAGQTKALKLCVEAEAEITSYENSLYQNEEITLLPEDVFIQQIQLYLLESRVYGKLASIKEIQRCHYEDKNDAEYQDFCSKQEENIEHMEESIGKAETLRKARNEKTGEYYGSLNAEIEHLLGECYFKKSQFYNENIQYPNKCKNDADTDLAARKSETYYYQAAKSHYKEALQFYRKYSGQYKLQAAGVLRNLADLYCRRAKSVNNKKEYIDKAYKYLEDAYMYYRSCNNLHGIADVLQSMGELEDFKKKPENGHRSGFCFYHTACRLYSELGDEWSRYVVSAFLEEAKGHLKKN